MNPRLIPVLLALVMLSTAAFSVPTAEEVSKVLDHYKNGNQVVLVEYKFCTDVAREGENRNECTATVDPSALASGEKVYLWMNFMVPQSATPNVYVQFNKGGRSFKTREIKMSGSYRYRTWTTVPTSKSGAWDVAVDQEAGENFLSIASISYTVTE